MVKCVSCNFCVHLCLVFEFMADDMPLYYIGRCYAVADVVAIYCGRYYNH